MRSKHTTLGQSRLRSSGNEGVFHTPQTVRTVASPWDTILYHTFLYGGHAPLQKGYCQNILSSTERVVCSCFKIIKYNLQNRIKWNNVNQNKEYTFMFNLIIPEIILTWHLGFKFLIIGHNLPFSALFYHQPWSEVEFSLRLLEPYYI